MIGDLGHTKIEGSGPANGHVNGHGNGLPGSDVATPRGTMVIVLGYALITVVLWGYIYYNMLRFQGIAGGY